MSTPIIQSNVPTSEHSVHFTDSQGHQVYVLSGICILDPVPTGPQDGSRWRRGKTEFGIPVPNLPAGQGLVIDQWAPTLVLGSIQNDGVANNAGWAVDDFNLEVSPGVAVSTVFAVFDYAVGDTDGQLRRVAYTVTIVGHFGKLPIIP
jgi:hypothetical protein